MHVLASVILSELVIVLLVVTTLSMVVSLVIVWRIDLRDAGRDEDAPPDPVTVCEDRPMSRDPTLRHRVAMAVVAVVGLSALVAGLEPVWLHR